MEHFFSMRGEIPLEITGFTLFDGTHICWLAACAVLCAILCLTARRLDEKGRRRLDICLGCALLALNWSRAVFLMFKGEYGISYLPLHLCGMSVYIEAIDCLFPNKLTSELCYAVCMPGAAMALLFPNWKEYPPANFMSVFCFALHGLLVIYPLVKVLSGAMKPSQKNLPLCAAFLAAVSLPVHMLNRRWGTNFMFLERPPAGSPLALFEKWLGNPGYLFGFPVMIAVLWLALYSPNGIKTLKAKHSSTTKEQ